MKPLFLAAALVGAAPFVAAPAWAAPIPVTVLGPDGLPIAGATLDAVIVDLSKPGSQRAALPVTPTAQGRWNVEWNGSLGTGLERASQPFALVRAQAPGMAAQTVRLAAGQNVVHLTQSRPWSGVVLDRDERPIAGACVVVYQWKGTAPGAPGALFWALQPPWRLETTTDAAGRWHLDGLPARARVFVALTGPPVAMDGFEIERDADEAPPIFARRGATVTGRLVAPDGHALANVPVLWQSAESSSNAEPARTDATGRFALSGLGAGNGSLISWNPDGPPVTKDVGYIIPRLEGLTARGGQTTDVGPWRAQYGVLVRGQVVDAATKKPVAGAKIELFASALGATSDAAGRFVLRAGREGDQISGGVEAPNYAYKPIILPAFKANQSALDLGPLPVVRGTRLTLSLKVLGAAPNARRPFLSVFKDNLSQGLNFDQGVGPLLSPALEAGRYHLMLPQDVDSNGPQWQLVSPQTLLVPAPGAPRAKVEIVVRSLQRNRAPLSEVRGRITDDQGKGVAGALINAQLDAGDYTRSARTLSDSEGNYIFRGPFFATPIALTVERPGYEAVGQANTKFEGEVAYVSGVTLKRR